MNTYVAFYIRVSSKAQNKSYGPTIQIDYCNKIAKKHGWVMYKTYYNSKSVSGDVNVEDRPEFIEMLEDARNKKFETVILYHIDRLGRKREIINKALDTLFDANLKVYIKTKFIKNTVEGRFKADQEAEVAEKDRKEIIERMAAGMEKAGIERGETQGLIPYGYKRIGKGKNLRIEIVDYEANVIIRIYESRLKGLTQDKIAEMLNNENIKPPRAKKWSQKTISLLLSTPKREIYQGGLRNNNESGVCWPKLLPDHLHVEIEQIEED